MFHSVISRFTALAVICAIPMVPIFAQGKNSRWGVSLESKSTVSCVTERVGSVVTYFQSTKIVPGEEITNYGFTEEVLKFNCPAALAFRAGAEYRLSPNTTLGISVARAASSNSLTKTVTSDRKTLTWIQIAGWGDANITPVDNKQAGGISPVSFYAEDEQRWLEVDARATQLLDDNGSYRITGSIGLKYVRFNYGFKTGETQVAQGETSAFLYDNYITLRSSAVSNANMAGPQLGITVEKNLGRLSTRVGATGALLRASTCTDGRFDDVDNITLYLQDGGTLPEPFYYILLAGKATSGRECLTRWTTNGSLRFQTGTRLGPLELGIGADLSYYGGAVTAPYFINPWSMTSSQKAPTGLRWEPQVKNIVNSSLFALGKISF